MITIWFVDKRIVLSSPRVQHKRNRTCIIGRQQLLGFDGATLKYAPAHSSVELERKETPRNRYQSGPEQSRSGLGILNTVAFRLVLFVFGYVVVTAIRVNLVGPQQHTQIYLRVVDVFPHLHVLKVLVKVRF